MCDKKHANKHQVKAKRMKHTCHYHPKEPHMQYSLLIYLRASSNACVKCIYWIRQHKSVVPIKMMEIQGEQRKRRNIEAFKLKQKLGDKTEEISKKDRENAVVRTAYHNRT